MVHAKAGHRTQDCVRIAVLCADFHQGFTGWRARLRRRTTLMRGDDGFRDGPDGSGVNELSTIHRRILAS